MPSEQLQLRRHNGLLFVRARLDANLPLARLRAFSHGTRPYLWTSLLPVGQRGRGCRGLYPIELRGQPH